MNPADTLTPSMRPAVGMTWPMVAYAFVRELPYTAMIVGGSVLAVVFVVRSPGSALEPLAAVIGPAIVSALGRSRPAEMAQLGGVAAVLAKWKGGMT